MPDGDAPGNERDRRLVHRLLMPRTIRHRLMRILLVSVTLALVLLGIIIVGRHSDYSQADDTEKAVSLALTVQDLIRELQQERGLTYDEPPVTTSILRQRTNTDRALAELNKAVAAEDTPGAREVRDALDRLTAVISTRWNVDTDRADRSSTGQWYTAAIAALNEVEPGMDQARDPELRKGLRALSALSAANEATAQEREFLTSVFDAGHFRAGEYIRFTEIRAARLAGIAAFRDDATMARRIQLDTSLESQAAEQAAAAERVATSSVADRLAYRIDPAVWRTQMTSVLDQMWAVQRALGEDLRQGARELRTDAAGGLVAFLFLALLAIGLEIALVVGCLRSIVRPLAALTAQAHDVATRRLPSSAAALHAPGADQLNPPEPVRAPARAATEIASAAHALDRVQSTAFELAGKQALLRRNTTESLANLGRRNQHLVHRQLGFISELEHAELDPKALANLFELDHMATRMRRNAESLLVLAGKPSPRRSAEPLAITDVIRAGISEVADYRRVSLRGVDDVHVTGAMVGELAHLLAELIDNALSFSAPLLPVEIHGERTGVRYALSVVDHGPGMSPAQLATANARLRGTEDFTVAPTQFLGHHVAGRLARRLGVEAELTQSPTSGITAQLLLPETMLADPSAPRPESDTDHAGQSHGPAPETDIPAGNSSTAIIATTPDAQQEHLAAGPAIAQIPHNGLVKRTHERQSGESRPGFRTVENRSPDEIRTILKKVRSTLRNNTADDTTDKDTSR
ncbi:nitrate- and nitrite sensing domain-containing protein [Kibdelosporangium philippinense]